MTEQSLPLTYRDLACRLVQHRLGQEDMQQLLRGFPPDQAAALFGRIVDVAQAVAGIMSIQRTASDLLPAEKLPVFTAGLLSVLRAADCRIYVRGEAGRLFALRRDGSTIVDLPGEGGLVGAVLADGVPVLVNDLGVEARFDPAFDCPEGEPPGGLLCAPISDAGQVVGALMVTDKLQDAFTLADLAMAQVAAGWMLPVLRNETAAFMTKADFESRLVASRETVSGTGLDESLRQILAVAVDMLDGDRGAIYLQDPETGELWSRAAEGLDHRQIRLPSNRSIAGAVFTTGEAARVPDAYADARFDSAIDRLSGYRTRNVVCVPIQSPATGRRLGVLQVINKRVGDFDVTDERRLRALARQAALAIDNCALFDEMASVKSYHDSILCSLTNGVMTIDPQGVILFANPATETMLRSEELVGSSVRDLFDGLNAWLVEEFAAACEQGEKKEMPDVELAVGDDWITVNLSLQPLLDAKKQRLGLIVTLDDVTRERRIQRTMSRYVDEGLVETLIDDAPSLDSAGRSMEASVLMSDIRGFTRLTEVEGGAETVRMLNEYFSYMEDVVTNRKGMVDKYIGDALLALFGAPASSGQDADNAVTAAIDMQRVLVMLNSRRQASGRVPLQVGVGIASGSVVTGNIGSAKRTSFTAIGNPVNLSARLESLTKLYGVDVMICETTRLRMHATSPLMRRLDIIRVRGQNTATTIFEIVDHRPDAREQRFTDMLGQYETALVAYCSGDWERARSHFQKATELYPDDAPSRNMLLRCRRLLTSPPDAWEGVWNYH